jgi:hypothetical protein
LQPSGCFKLHVAGADGIAGRLCIMGDAGTSMEPVMGRFSFSLSVLAFFPLSPFGAVASLDADASLDPSASLAPLGGTLSCKHD